VLAGCNSGAITAVDDRPDAASAVAEPDAAPGFIPEPTAETGGTVLVCSLTTTIGYASLLVSDNLAIRGFGLASLIGEITCVVAALALVPAIVGLRRGIDVQLTERKSSSERLAAA